MLRQSCGIFSSIIVTGAGRGLGFAASVVLARAGHTVYATMRNPDKFPQLGLLATKESLPIYISKMDVVSDESVTCGVSDIQRQGPVDVLVNAAIDCTATTDDISKADFRSVMETSFFGSLRCIKSVLPQMRERRSGSIINVLSYCSSKFALEALSEALAGEAKTFNIRVAIVEPGFLGLTGLGDDAIEVMSRPSACPQTARMLRLFQQSVKGSAPPELVADKIREIVESETWQMRHPVGPDAERFNAWRASFTDEHWAEFNGADDVTWYAQIEKDLGVNLRQALAQ